MARMAQLNQLMNNCLKNYQLQEEKGDLEKVKKKRKEKCTCKIHIQEDIIPFPVESTFHLTAKQAINIPYNLFRQTPYIDQINQF